MTKWNQVGFDHYRSAPNGGIIWISPDDDRPEGYSIILNKDGETKELGFAEDLGDAKDIADRECRAMESVGSLKGCTLSGDWKIPTEFHEVNVTKASSFENVVVSDWKIEDKKLSWALELGDSIDEYATIPKETYESMRERIASAVNGNVKPLAQTIANLKTAIKDAEEENPGDDWEDSTIKTWDEK